MLLKENTRNLFSILNARDTKPHGGSPSGDSNILIAMVLILQQPASLLHLGCLTPGSQWFVPWRSQTQEYPHQAHWQVPLHWGRTSNALLWQNSLSNVSFSVRMNSCYSILSLYSPILFITLLLLLPTSLTVFRFSVCGSRSKMCWGSRWDPKWGYRDGCWIWGAWAFYPSS